jgi:hypothetical protein
MMIKIQPTGFKLWFLLLLISGTSKFLDIIETNEYWVEYDRVLFFMTRRQVAASAALLELGVAVYLVSRACLLKKAYSLLWLSGILSTYKAGTWLLQDVRPCSCLGVVGRALDLSAGQLDLVTSTMLLLMAVNSLVVIMLGRVAGKNT